ALAQTVGWVAIALLALLAWHWRSVVGDRTLCLLAVMALAQVAVLAAHQTQLVRHVVPAALPVVVLAAWSAARAAEAALARMTARAAAVVAVGLVMLLATARAAVRPASLDAPASASATAALADVAGAVAQLAQGRHFMLVGAGDLDQPTGLDWRLVAEERILEPSRAAALGEVGRGEAAASVLQRLEHRGVRLRDLERAVQRSTGTDRSRSVYLSPEAWRAPGAALEALWTRLALERYPVIV